MLLFIGIGCCYDWLLMHVFEVVLWSSRWDASVVAIATCPTKVTAHNNLPRRVHKYKLVTLTPP